jgi:hypothetical protein
MELTALPSKYSFHKNLYRDPLLNFAYSQGTSNDFVKDTRFEFGNPIINNLIEPALLIDKSYLYRQTSNHYAS